MDWASLAGVGIKLVLITFTFFTMPTAGHSFHYFLPFTWQARMAADRWRNLGKARGGNRGPWPMHTVNLDGLKENGKIGKRKNEKGVIVRLYIYGLKKYKNRV